MRSLSFPACLNLTYTSSDLQPFAEDLGYDGAPFRWDEDRRFLLQCEIDAALFHLYGLERDDVDYVMETFPIVTQTGLPTAGRRASTSCSAWTATRPCAPVPP